uniref:Uncharacterized protein n=1 Tax=Sphenodon punctatus TaxID=8508 RepID=A0A8D0G8Q3_SPHPU
MMQCLDSALHLTPKKNTCSYRSHVESAIGSSRPNLASGQQLSDTLQEEEVQSEPFQQQAETLTKTVQQVRRRLASCKTVSEGGGPSELPGGAWGVDPTRDEPVSSKPSSVKGEEGGSEEFPLAGHHDLPAELQEQMKNQAEQGKGMYYKIEIQKICSKLAKDSSFTAAPLGSSPENQAALVLWPGIDKEETKKQRQSQYLRYRRLFMDMEREQVKEQEKQKEQQKRIEK